MPREYGLPGQGRTATLRECDLKICELCGWINLESSTECFVCGWHGRFERDPAAVHAAVELALRTQGRLEVENLTEVSFIEPPTATSVVYRISPVDSSVCRALQAVNNRQRAQDGGSFQIAVIGGIPVRIHLTFLLLLAFIGFAGASAGHNAAVPSVLFILALFGCVVLHELSHAAVASRYGIRTLSITLYPIGGVALLEKPPRPVDEFWIALAGPMMNLVIAGALAVVIKLGHLKLGNPHLGYTASGFPSDLMWANLVLGAFNMIPAFPMDGGRVLRALIAMTTDETRATEIAAAIGQFLAFAVGLFALFAGDFLLLLVAAFVYFGAGQEAGAFRTRSLLLGHKVREAMLTDYHTLPVGASLKEATQILLSGSQHDFPVEHGGEIVGLLRRDDLMRGLASQEEGAYVAGIMDREFPRTEPDADMETVLSELGRAGTVLVMDKDDGGKETLVGMLTQENAVEFLMLAQLASRRVKQ